MSDTITFYKIRHRVTGKYSKGGSYANAEGNNIFWNNSGKTWDTLGKLRAHLTSHMNRYYGATDISDWEVVEFVSRPTSVKPVYEVIDPKKLVEMLKR